MVKLVSWNIARRHAAWRCLPGFVFASEGMGDSVNVSALNGLDEWGPSDHCRIEIVVEP